MSERVIDKGAIFDRAMDAARIAAEGWEAKHPAALEPYDPELFAYAFHAGMIHGIYEAKRIDDGA